MGDRGDVESRCGRASISIIGSVTLEDLVSTGRFDGGVSFLMVIERVVTLSAMQRRLWIRLSQSKAPRSGTLARSVSALPVQYSPSKTSHARTAS